QEAAGGRSAAQGFPALGNAGPGGIVGQALRGGNQGLRRSAQVAADRRWCRQGTSRGPAGPCRFQGSPTAADPPTPTAADASGLTAPSASTPSSAEAARNQRAS